MNEELESKIGFDLAEILGYPVKVTEDTSDYYKNFVSFSSWFTVEVFFVPENEYTDIREKIDNYIMENTNPISCSCVIIPIIFTPEQSKRMLVGEDEGQHA